MKKIHVKPNIYAYYFESIKDIGIKYGYNIVVHGSLNRDLDLIAIPWTISLHDYLNMIKEIATYLGGYIMDQAEKETNCFPHGRKSYVINIRRGDKKNNYVDAEYYLDISVIPAIKK